MLRLFHNNMAVGVAPGTTTLQLGRLGCPPENMPLMAYDRLIGVSNSPDPMIVAAAGQMAPTNPHDCMSVPYQDTASMKGLGAVPQSRIRWDIIALIGGGSMIVALMAGLIAHAMAPTRAR